MFTFSTGLILFSQFLLACFQEPVVIEDKCVLAGIDLLDKGGSNNMEGSPLADIATWMDCLGECRKKDGCKVFVYVAAEHADHTGKAKNCFLKTPAKEDDPVKKQGLISGHFNGKCA